MPLPLVVACRIMQAAAPTWLAVSARFTAGIVLSDSRVVTTEMPCALSIERIMADLYRIVTGFEPAEHCPEALVQWASGPSREALYAGLFGT